MNGKASDWSTVSAGVPQDSVLGPLLFLVYLNYLPDNVLCAVKLFADDTSLFSVVNNEHHTGLELNRDLKNSRMWAWQWKISIKTDKTEEVICPWKNQNPTSPFSN